MRQLPRVGLVVFLGRGQVDRMMKPAIPARRSHRSLGNPVIDHPPPLEPERRIDAWSPIIDVAELVMSDQHAKTLGVEPRVEVRAVPPSEIVQQKLLDMFQHPWSAVLAQALRAPDYGDEGFARQADFFVDCVQKWACGLAPTRWMLPVRAGVKLLLSTLSTICCVDELVAIQVVDAVV